MRVVSLGDLALDVVVRTAGPVARGADTPAAVSLSAGGQGANVAAWVAALGGESAWLGKRASDDAGRLAAQELERRGVRLLGPVEETGNGIVVSLVDETGERSMFPDRGVATLLRPDELSPGWLDCDHLHVSGYALTAELPAAAAARAVELAHGHGARVSVDLASWSVIRDRSAGGFRELVASLAPDVVFTNEDEDRDLRWAARGRRLDREAGRAGLLVRRRGAGRAPGRVRGRHDRRGRRARRRLDRGRRRPRARRGRPVRPACRARCRDDPGTKTTLSCGRCAR